MARRSGAPTARAWARSPSPSFARRAGSTYFFEGSDDTHGDELWRSDGTSAGTFLLKDIFPGAGSSRPYAFTELNGTMFFTANDGVHGWELWKSDGTVAGTVLFKDFHPGPESS